MSEKIPGFKQGLGRLWSTGKVASSAARLAARRVVGLSGEAGTAVDARLGEALARELDSMKGMAMKVGQILSYFDGVLPDSTLGALRGLQHGATAVAWDALREVLEQGLGGRVEELFEQFDTEPVAAASVGQVYRAVHRGRAVAVKVQYPGIAATLQGDFQRIGALAGLASLLSAVDGQAIVEELRARVVEECDYLAEAGSQTFFASAFEGDPLVRIPPVIDERTCRTVLTTEWCDGADFYALLEASAARRNEVALTLTRFAYHSLWQLGRLNADPHPGNYLFDLEPGGPISFLDFGCVRAFDADYLEAQRRLTRIVLEGDEPAFPQALRAAGLVGRDRGYDYDYHWALLRHELSPYLSQPYRSQPYRFTPEFLKKSFEFARATQPNARKMAVPPQWIWQQRLQTGLHAILIRLRAEGDFATPFRQALEG